MQHVQDSFKNILQWIRLYAEKPDIRHILYLIFIIIIILVTNLFNIGQQ